MGSSISIMRRSYL